MKRLFRGPATFWNQHYWNHFKLVLLPIALVDVIADYINPDGLIRGPVRIAPILRPFLFTANIRSIRETMLSTVHIIWDVKVRARNPVIRMLYTCPSLYLTLVIAGAALPDHLPRGVVRYGDVRILQSVLPSREWL